MMKLQVSLVIAILLLMTIPLISGCALGSEISTDEAIAIVQQYALEHNTAEQPWGRTVTLDRGSSGEWEASYEGKGRWMVTSWVERERDIPPPPSLTWYWVYSWNYYESSGVVDYRGGNYEAR